MTGVLDDKVAVIKPFILSHLVQRHRCLLVLPKETLDEVFESMREDDLNIDLYVKSGQLVAMEPEILIADEAVSALDVSVQAQVLTLLDDVRARFNLAVLFITHDLRVAAQVCHRIAVMQNGAVVEEGPTGDIFRAPRHPYTRALFEAAPGRKFDFGRFEN